MKESIGSVWLFSLVLVFILMFSAYLIVTLNYSKAFKIKNEVLTIIEKRNGIIDGGGYSTVESRTGSGDVFVPDSALGTINAFLAASGYTAKGSCVDLEGKWYGVDELVFSTNGSNVSYSVEEAGNGSKYYYCFSKKLRLPSCAGTNFSAGSTRSKLKNGAYYYDVLLFYKLDIPPFGEIFTFNVEGTTAEIYNIADTRAGSCV